MNRRVFILGVGVAGALSSVSSRSPAEDLRGLARGVVLGGAKPLRKVRVSDGYRVVVTDADGRFELPISGESSPFVFVTVPSGYWTDRFFVRTTEATSGPVQFRLDPLPEARDHFALFVTDIHLGEGRREEGMRRFAATLAEINRMDPQPAFVWTGGDMTLQGGKGAAYTEAICPLKARVRHFAGNHELHVGRPEPKDEYYARFGPTYYAFDVGSVHYVGLDGCIAVPEEK